jgi:hypothetical protein
MNQGHTLSIITNENTTQYSNKETKTVKTVTRNLIPPSLN